MKFGTVAISGVVLGLLFTLPHRAVSQESKAGSELKIHVNYTGAGPVDDKHKIYVALWDSPDFVNGNGAPTDMKSTSSKDGTVTFSDLSKTPVYVSTVYDSSGAWDAQSAPPEGSPLGLYSKEPGKPAPVELKPGETTSIDLKFDDSYKMKSGKPGL